MQKLQKVMEYVDKKNYVANQKGYVFYIFILFYIVKVKYYVENIKCYLLCRKHKMLFVMQKKQNVICYVKNRECYVLCESFTN